MNKERKQELVEYIELLGKLQGNGLKYNLEINKAVKELNSLIMGVDVSKNALDKFRDSFSLIEDKKGKLVIVDNKCRGIGKSTILADYAYMYCLPIIVGNNHYKENLIELSKKKDTRLHQVEVYSVHDIKGKRFSSGVLIDESVSVVDVERIIFEYNMIIRGGFIYSDLYI